MRDDWSLGPLNHDGFPMLLKDDPSIHNFHEPTRFSRIDAKSFSRSLEKGTCFAQQGNQSIGPTLTIPLFTNAPRNLHLRMAERASLSYGGHDVGFHLSKHTIRRLFNSHGKVNWDSITLGFDYGHFSLVSLRILDFVEKIFLFLPVSNKAKVLKSAVTSMGYSNYRFTGTAIAFMSGKKGRGNGDNYRDHSSHEPFETGCTARSPYLRHTHLPDRVSGYRKCLVKKRVRGSL